MSFGKNKLRKKMQDECFKIKIILIKYIKIKKKDPPKFVPLSLKIYLVGPMINIGL
jgi:hypothetical protein